MHSKQQGLEQDTAELALSVTASQQQNPRAGGARGARAAPGAHNTSNSLQFLCSASHCLLQSKEVASTCQGSSPCGHSSVTLKAPGLGQERPPSTHLHAICPPVDSCAALVRTLVNGWQLLPAKQRPGQPACRGGGCPGAPSSSLPLTLDFFFPAWLWPWLLPYFGLFCLLGFFAIAFLARNPPRRNKDRGFILDLGLFVLPPK